MNTIATTVEQAKELLDLGIDPNTASMIWVSLGRNCKWILNLAPYKDDEKDNFWAYRPAWTLVDLIGLLPDEITKDGQKYTLSIGKDEISYIYINTQRIVPVACLYNFEGNLIDAAVEAIKAVKKLMS